MVEEQSSSRRRYLVAGVVVVTVALWLLLDSMGVAVPSWKRFWPVFPLLGGLVSTAFFFLRQGKPGALGKGVAGILTGLLFFSFTYGHLDWRQFGQWWSAIPLILGLAFLATWVAGKMSQPPYLILALIGMGLGLTGFSAHFDWLEKLMPPAAVVWGVALLGIGGLFIWRSMKKS